MPYLNDMYLRNLIIVLVLSLISFCSWSSQKRKPEHERLDFNLIFVISSKRSVIRFDRWSVSLERHRDKCERLNLLKAVHFNCSLCVVVNGFDQELAYMSTVGDMRDTSCVSFLCICRLPFLFYSSFSQILISTC